MSAHDRPERTQALVTQAKNILTGSVECIAFRAKWKVSPPELQYTKGPHHNQEAKISLSESHTKTLSSSRNESARQLCACKHITFLLKYVRHKP